MWSYVKEKGLGEALYAPLDVIFAEDDVYQPDIVYVSKENVNIIKENGIFGAPDLIVEIISPGTAIYDVVDKREIYEGYGVKELWFVNPDEKAGVNARAAILSLAAARAQPAAAATDD